MTLELDLRRLIAEGEAALGADGARGQGKEPLMPQYRLLLRLLAKGRSTTAARLDDWLRVARALREGDQLAALRDAEAADGAVMMLDSPLAVLSARLRRLPDHALVAVEPGADVLTWFALCGGPGAVTERAAMACASAEGVQAIEQLIGQHYSDVERLRTDAAIDDALFSPMRTAARRAWDTLPPAIAALLASAKTVLYWASSFGSLGELPLELLHDGEEWLGISHAVGRIASWRTLLEMLSPNRMPSVLSARAQIVRARDVADADVLSRADLEIAAVELQLERRGMTTSVERAPTRGTTQAALDSGCAALHYIGHGVAGSSGEFLPLDNGEMLRPEDLSELSGWRCPFVYLSTCEVGRSRAGRTGRTLGFAPRMIEKGVPAVVDCLQPVNDEVALEMARAVYGNPPTLRLGDALARARQELERSGYPPACWGAYVLFGDPNVVLPSSTGDLQQTRHLTRDWSAEVARWAALRSAHALSRAREALAGTVDGDELTAEELGFVTEWLASDVADVGGREYFERDEFCDRIAGRHPLGAAALRILLAIEAVDGVYAKGKPPFVLADPPTELRRGIDAARATHDMIAWPALAVRLARVMEQRSDTDRLRARRLLDEAEGALAGWVHEEPDAARLADSAKSLRQATTQRS